MTLCGLGNSNRCCAGTNCAFNYVCSTRLQVPQDRRQNVNSQSKWKAPNVYNVGGDKVLYRTIIFPVVLYGCETSLREEHRLRVFENRALSRIFVPKRDGVTGEWRK